MVVEGVILLCVCVGTSDPSRRQIVAWNWQCRVRKFAEVNLIQLAVPQLRGSLPA